MAAKKSKTDKTKDAPKPEAAETPKAEKSAKKNPKPKKTSALDAAAKVLGEAGQPMTCLEMIETMSKKGLWTSPNGATPQATLYSALLREIKTKGKEARFQKTERGSLPSTDSRDLRPVCLPGSHTREPLLVGGVFGLWAGWPRFGPTWAMLGSLEISWFRRVAIPAPRSVPPARPIREDARSVPGSFAPLPGGLKRVLNPSPAPKAP